MKRLTTISLYASILAGVVLVSLASLSLINALVNPTAPETLWLEWLTDRVFIITGVIWSVCILLVYIEEKTND